MKATCTNCTKIFQTQGNDKNGICQSCVLQRLTNGRPPEIEDVTTAAFVSREMSKSEWREFQAELRRYHPGDFLTEEDEICERCGRNCTCDEERREYAKWLSEAPLRAMEDAFDRLYNEALREDEERMKIARWQAMYEESEALHLDMMEQAEQEWNNSFNPLLYNLFGWKYYYRYVAPILIRLYRFKKGWRR